MPNLQVDTRVSRCDMIGNCHLNCYSCCDMGNLWKLTSSPAMEAISPNNDDRVRNFVQTNPTLHRPPFYKLSDTHCLLMQPKLVFL